MEISERSLRRMVREVDDLHREGMKIIAEDIAALHTGAAAQLRDPSRRQFLRNAGLGGLAVAVGGAAISVGEWVSPAAASMTGDIATAKFAESVELAVVAAYGIALQSGKLTTPAVITAVTTFKGHHMEHAQAFGAFAGDTAIAQPNPMVLQQVVDTVREAANQTAVLQAAFTAENAAAATYLVALGTLTSTAALSATASIMPVEAQHCALLGYVLGMDPDTDTDYVPPFQAPDDAIIQSKYPIAPNS